MSKPEMASDAAYSRLLRAQVDEMVQENQTYDLTLSSAIHTITSFYTNHSNADYPLILIENRLHDLWYTFIQAAKHIHPLEASQDNLIRFLMLARALGPLQRPETRLGSNDSRKRILITTSGPTPFSDGSLLWSGLPLFGTDLVDEFSSRYYQNIHYHEDQRNNLAAFMGRLLSVGIYDGPALCALSLFREALETPRPLVTDPNSREVSDTLLPLEDVIAPLHHLLISSEFSVAILSSNHLAAAGSMSNINFADYPHLSGLGELARQSGTIPSFSSGFSAERWKFWIQRLEELQQSNVRHIVGDATSCLTVMTSAQEDLGLI